MRIQPAFVALVASVAWLLFAAGSHAAVSQPAATLATQVAPRGTTIACIRMSNGDEGRTYENQDGSFLPNLDLSLDTCKQLDRLAQHRLVSLGAEANALETLLHEAHHLSLASGDESRVECAALAALPFWLARLGYTGTLRSRLVRAAWRDHYQLGAQYQGCSRSPRVRPLTKP